MKKFFARLWKEQIAQDLVEYALILLLIALAAVTSIQTLSNGIKNAYSTTSSTVRAGGNGGGNNGGQNNGGQNNGGQNNGGQNNGGQNNGGQNNGGQNNGGQNNGPCWIAAAVYGEDFYTGPRVNLVRRWLVNDWENSGPVPHEVMAMYRTYGQRVARVVDKSPILKGGFRMLFDVALRKAEAKYGKV